MKRSLLLLLTIFLISCSSDYVENEAVEESVDKEPTEIRIAYFATGSSAHNLKRSYKYLMIKMMI